VESGFWPGLLTGFRDEGGAVEPSCLNPCVGEVPLAFAPEEQHSAYRRRLAPLMLVAPL